MGKRWMGAETWLLPTSTIEIIKPVIEVVWLAIVFVSMLFSQVLDCFISRSLFRRLKDQNKERWGMLVFWILP